MLRQEAPGVVKPRAGAARAASIGANAAGAALEVGMSVWQHRDRLSDPMQRPGRLFATFLQPEGPARLYCQRSPTEEPVDEKVPDTEFY